MAEQEQQIRHSRLSRDKTKKNDESSDVERHRKDQNDEMTYSARHSKIKENSALDNELNDGIQTDKDRISDRPQVVDEVNL
jgi:hypothetical protein